jgi:hypothetical protein
MGPACKFSFSKSATSIFNFIFPVGYLSLKLPLLTKSKVKLGSLLLAVAWNSPLPMVPLRSRFYSCICYNRFFDGPFTVASAVLDLIQILWWWHFQLFFQTNCFWWVFQDQNCWVLFWHYIFLFFILWSNKAFSFAGPKLLSKIRSVEVIYCSFESSCSIKRCRQVNGIRIVSLGRKSLTSLPLTQVLYIKIKIGFVSIR